MTFDKNQIREIVAGVLEVEVSEVGDEDNFVTDLAMNSLQMLDCIAEVEDVIGIRIAKGELRNLTSVNKMAIYLEGL